MLVSLLAVGPAQAQANRYTVSADGSMVADGRTGLVWQRCALGQVPPSCIGTATTFTHEQALTAAANQAGAGWRLPNVKELVSLVDRTVVVPTIDALAFPGTPATWFWSSSPVVGSPSLAWYVFFNDGYVGNSYRSNPLAVRLVR